jgi:hypothetical protein
MYIKLRRSLPTFLHAKLTEVFEVFLFVRTKCFAEICVLLFVISVIVNR